jgi:hypothetical protein
MSEAAISTVLETEPLIRLSAFIGVFALLAAWEVLAPRRSQDIGRTWRWPNNLGVVVLDTLVLRVLFPTAAVGFALEHFPLRLHRILPRRSSWRIRLA